MKANELMLGDLVYGLYPNGSRYANPFRISAVDIYPLNRSPRIVTMGGYEFHEEHLEPIRLTPKILEKNFGNVGSNDIPYISMLVNGNFHSKMINFVHELQHALRLCGMNELAENFKV